MSELLPPKFQRRIQQIGRRTDEGKGSFIVTLPKEWCEENKIKKGQIIEMSISDFDRSTILLTLPEKSQERTEVFEIIIEESNEKALSRASRSILGAYLNGYEEIKISGIPKETEKKLSLRTRTRKLKNKLYGCSFEEHEGYFILQISSELKSPTYLLKNLFNKSNLMFKDAIIAIIKNDKNLAQDIILRDEEADSLYFQLVRTLKTLMRNPISVINSMTNYEFDLLDTIDYRMIASYLEKLGDYAENIAESVVSSNFKSIRGVNLKKIEKFGFEISNLLEKSFDNYFTRNGDNAITYITATKEMNEKIDTLSNSGLTTIIIRSIENAMKLIVDICEFVN